MKSSLLALLLMAGASQAAITISGTAARDLQNATGTGAAAGAAALLIVDTTGNGFLGMGAIEAGTTLTAANDPGITQAGTTIGSFFGGDLVLNTMTASASGGVAGLLNSVNVADYVNMAFAVVWLQADGKYGIIRGADWTFPAADSGATYTMNATDNGVASTYYQITSNAPTAGSMNFRTGFTGGNSGAVFTIVPEPSVALLGALGVFGLVRRRR